jgi:hypothetical protein
MGGTTGERSSRWTRIHLATVLVLMVAAWLTTRGAEDASIGGGFLLLGLVLLGMPWTLVPLVLVQPTGYGQDIVAYGLPALLNVVLLRWYSGHRKRTAA